MPGHRIFAAPFASIYPHYVTKAERKNRSKDEVDQVIAWLTGYDAAGLETAIATQVDLETFFAEAPAMNPHAAEIRGLICGYRVERSRTRSCSRSAGWTSSSTSSPGARR